MVKGLAYLNEAMSHALQDYPKTDKSQWRVLTKCGPLEEGMANYSSILDQRSPLAVWKGKKTWHQKMSPRGQVSNIGEVWRAITNSARKNEGTGSKWKRRSIVDGSVGESKVQCFKGQY